MKRFIILIGLSLALATNNKKIFKINAPEVESILVPQHILDLGAKLKTLPQNDATRCQICEVVTEGVISLRKSNATREIMLEYLTRLCLSYTSWGPIGCTVTNIRLDTVLYIIDNTTNLTPAKFCAITFQSYKCEDPNADNWTIPLPAKLEKIFVRKLAEEKPLRILQLTDVHIDPLYIAGSDADCTQPLCCQSGKPANPVNAAGYWGDYAVCDMPWHSLQNLLDTIKEKHEVLDYVYFTGDIVSHKGWDISVKINSETIKQFFDMLYETFGNVTVFPILGNHESYPADYYSPDTVEKTSNVSTQWLYNLITDEWSKWLPNNTKSTLMKGGFYTVLVKPGFRIIALNSNVCYIANLWLVYNNTDTYGQLQWMVDVLTEAEKNAERVHILSHVPSGDDVSSCAKVWSREFKKIVLRFKDTISMIFNGHTHQDEFKLYFNTNQQVNAVAFNGGSFTTFIGNNPNYRIYEVDSNNLTVTDYSQYMFNLTDANLNTTTPQWFKLYSFKAAYNLPDLTLNSLGGLYKRMLNDNEIVQQYYQYMFRDSDKYVGKTCDLTCRKQLVCLIAAGESNESIDCINQ